MCPSEKQPVTMENICEVSKLSAHRPPYLDQVQLHTGCSSDNILPIRMYSCLSVPVYVTYDGGEHRHYCDIGASLCVKRNDLMQFPRGHWEEIIEIYRKDNEDSIKHRLIYSFLEDREAHVWFRQGMKTLPLVGIEISNQDNYLDTSVDEAASRLSAVYDRMTDELSE